MAEQPLRIGLIGVGHRAGMAEHFETDGRGKIVAGADINDTFLEQFTEKYEHNDPFVTDDYMELLDRDDVDAVGVYTPDFLHYEPTVAALRAGKHVFVEKPMAIHTEHCDEMIRQADKSGKKLLVGMNMRYSDPYQTLKDIIDSGKLGEVKGVWMRHFIGAGGRMFFHDYRANREGSNSMLLQKGAHDIDMIHFLTDRYTQRVTAMGSLDYFGGDYPNDLRCSDCDEKDTCPEFSTRDADVRGDDDLPKDMCAFRKEVNIEDHSTVLMDLGDAKAVYMECLYTSWHGRNYLVIGTEGQAELTNNQITITTQKANRTKSNVASTFSTADIDIGTTSGGHGGADPKLCRDFLDFVLEDKHALTSAEAGRMAVATGCAAIDSLRNGSDAVDIPPMP